MTNLKQPDDLFMGDVDKVDMAPLRNKKFLVAINSGDRQQAGLVPESIKGPLNFYEMIEEVGQMWKRDLHHAKVMILNGLEYADWLDEYTVDYIQGQFVDILYDEAFRDACGSEQDPDAEYECGIVKNTGPTIPKTED